MDLGQHETGLLCGTWLVLRVGGSEHKYPFCGGDHKYQRLSGTKHFHQICNNGSNLGVSAIGVKVEASGFQAEF